MTDGENIENKSSTMNIIIIGIISSIIGGLIVYYLLKPKITVASLQPINISSQIENRLDNIEQRLSQQQSSLLIQQPPQQLHQQSSQQLLQQLPQQANTLYKNNESWEIIRGKDGFISKLNVIRDVKTNK